MNQICHQNYQKVYLYNLKNLIFLYKHTINIIFNIIFKIGLKGIGMGLGAGGNRLMDVARNIPNVQANNPPVVNPISAPVLAAGAFGAGLNNVVPAQLGKFYYKYNIYNKINYKAEYENIFIYLL